MNERICYKIIKIDSEGIILEDQNLDLNISFDDCAKNYATEKSLKSSKCVATRDITTLSFTFYTVPKTKIIFKKHFLKDLIPGRSAVNRFLRLQKALIQFGYTSYDLS